MAESNGNLLDRGHISPDSLSPPESPGSSPERNPVRSSSTTSSFDRLPPAMSAQGTTPAPSDDHSDMVAHHASIELEDDDHHHHQNGRSRSHDDHPYSPPLPPTTATSLVQPLSNSITASPSSTFSQPDTPSTSPGPSSSTASRQNTSSHSDHHHSHSLSPFSFFGHSDASKVLRIELTHPEVVVMNGQSTVLEGVVYLTLHKNTKVKSLQLEFSGRSSVTWVDGKQAGSGVAVLICSI